MMWFNLFPIVVEIVMILVIFGSLFSYQFLLVQFGAILIYITLTYILTEWRASKFKAAALAD
jgi:ABC-type transport system involved in Fe-S cluster assembly fused permease/ATPase subunit